MPKKIRGHFTCDNSYSVWIGNSSQVIEKKLEATNTQAEQIAKGEDLPAVDPVPDCHLYICAWSDDGVYQGLIGSFTGEETIHTGDPRWRVLPTGVNKGNREFPTKEEINRAIASAKTSDWKVPFAGAANGGPPWNMVIQGIAKEARWVWHDSGKDSRKKYPQSPYVPFDGFNHDEFLIFRIPCQEFEEGPVDKKEEEPRKKEEGRCCVTVCQCCHDSHEKPPVPVVIQEKDCCDCGSCVFEVRLQRIRYVSGKAGWGDNWAELSFTTHVDGNMSNFPTGNGSYVRLGRREGGFWTGWMPINARVGILEVPCKGERSFDLMTEMVENPQKEKGPSAVLEGGRPWGASDIATITIQCGKKPGPVTQSVRLELGGNRTEDLAVDVEYRISQVTACSCCCHEEVAKK